MTNISSLNPTCNLLDRFIELWSPVSKPLEIVGSIDHALHNSLSTQYWLKYKSISQDTRYRGRKHLPNSPPILAASLKRASSSTLSVPRSIRALARVIIKSPHIKIRNDRSRARVQLYWRRQCSGRAQSSRARLNLPPGVLSFSLARNSRLPSAVGNSFRLARGCKLGRKMLARRVDSSSDWIPDCVCLARQRSRPSYTSIGGGFVTRTRLRDALV